MPKFIGDATSLRAAVAEVFDAGGEIRMAVAFITGAWKMVVHPSAFNGPCRILCWLSSTATDPYAVEDLQRTLNKEGELRQLDELHAKVYWSEGGGAVVGSANLSGAAFAVGASAAESERVEASVRLLPKEASAIAAWFEDIWATSREVSKDDLTKAKNAFRRSVRRRKKTTLHNTAREKFGGPPELEEAANDAYDFAFRNRGVFLGPVQQFSEPEPEPEPEPVIVVVAVPVVGLQLDVSSSDVAGPRLALPGR